MGPAVRRLETRTGPLTALDPEDVPYKVNHPAGEAHDGEKDGVTQVLVLGPSEHLQDQAVTMYQIATLNIIVITLSRLIKKYQHKNKN